MSKTRIVLLLVAMMLSSLGAVGCKVFVPERVFINGGAREGPGEQRTEPAKRLAEMDPGARIAPMPTETVVRWSSQENGELDRESTSNRAILQYGHKEKPEKVKAVKAPFLKLVKSIKDGDRERRTLSYDDPPPEKLIYRLKIANSGSATYRGRLELVDRLPDEVRYLGIKAVHKRHLVWLPYIGNVETKSKLKDWEVDPPSGGMGTRVRWSIDDVKLKKKHWITVDIEFEPPPFEVSMTSQAEPVSSTTAR